MRREQQPSGAAFWIAAVVGLAVIAFGVAGLLRNVDGDALTSFATLFAGGLIAHDGVVAPLVALLSLLLVRALPRWARPPLQAGLVVTALVLVIAAPLVLPGDTRLANNPSLLPGDYDGDLLIVLAAVWTVTLAVGARAWRRRRYDRDPSMTRPRIYTTSFARVYPLYVAKAEKKGRARAEVDEIIRWLTGYGEEALAAQLDAQVDVETFLAEAPRLNPARTSIRGVVCGVRVEELSDSPMKEIRYLDKLIDELAKGKSMDKILRVAA